MDTNTASYIKAVSQLDEITTTYQSASEITAAYANKTNSLVVPNIFNDTDSNQLLTEFSQTTEVGGYESKQFRFSTFAKNLYMLLSAANENFKAIKVDIETLDSKVNDICVGISTDVSNLDQKVDSICAGISTAVSNLDQKVDSICAGISTAVSNLDQKVDSICAGISTDVSELANGTSDKYLRTQYIDGQQIVKGPVKFNTEISGSITNALTANIALAAYWS